MKPRFVYSPGHAKLSTAKLDVLNNLGEITSRLTGQEAKRAHTGLMQLTPESREFFVTEVALGHRKLASVIDVTESTEAQSTFETRLSEARTRAEKQADKTGEAGTSGTETTKKPDIEPEPARHIGQGSSVNEQTKPPK